LPSAVLYSHQRPMLRTALAVTLVTAVSLGAQSQKPSQADSAAVLTAAREWVGKRDSTVAKDVIRLQADTAIVTVWTREWRFGRDGQEVRVMRRAGQWVAVRGAVSPIVGMRFQTAQP
jgi:hypothetical protein